MMLTQYPLREEGLRVQIATTASTNDKLLIQKLQITHTALPHLHAPQHALFPTMTSRQRTTPSQRDVKIHKWQPTPNQNVSLCAFSAHHHHNTQNGSICTTPSLITTSHWVYNNIKPHWRGCACIWGKVASAKSLCGMGENKTPQPLTIPHISQPKQLPARLPHHNPICYYAKRLKNPPLPPDARGTRSKTVDLVCFVTNVAHFLNFSLH